MGSGFRNLVMFFHDKRNTWNEHLNPCNMTQCPSLSNFSKTVLNPIDASSNNEKRD